MKNSISLVAWALLALPLSVKAQYVIYPIPHTMTAGTGSVSFTHTVTIVSEEGIDDYTKQRAASILNEKGIQTEFATEASATNSNVYLGIKGGQGAPSAKASSLGLETAVLTQANKFDRHILSLTDADGGKAQLVVIGENTDATFCGLASLEQMLDNGTANLTPVTIYDYADQQNRGIVEGYYGLPYSLEVKKDLMRFMMRYKMNTYLYGAKCDYYHSNHWKDAYPTSITAEQEKMGYMTQSMVKSLTDVAHETKVNFIWAIHPGNNLVNSSTVVSDVVNKYAMMYKLGVRQFAVFADDVSVPDTDEGMKTTANNITAIQQAIEAKWNKSYTTAADTVRPLQFVPQIYCRAFASSADQFNRFFNALSAIPSQVTVYTTGWGVWSVPNDGDFNTTQNQFGREVAWWWNYPCNDNGEGKSQVYPMDMYSNFADMPNVNSSVTLPSEITASTRGIVSNPMCQGEVSKTPLFSVADYTWNNKGFNNTTSWEASFKGILPGNEKAQAAYRFLAPYLRYNDPTTLNTLISKYKRTKDASELISLMTEIVENCETIEALESSSVDGERLLYKDLQTWLLRLHDMAQETKNLLTIAAETDKDDASWSTYLTDKSAVAELSENDKYKATILNGSVGSNLSTTLYLSKPAEKYLRPFLTDYIVKHALDDLFAVNTPATSPQIVTNAEGVKARVATTSAAIRLRTTGVAKLNPGEFVGAELATSSLVSSIEVADTLLNNYSILISGNGKEWTKLTEKVTTPDSYVHYVVVANESEQPKTLKLVNASLGIYPHKATTITSGTIPEGNIYDNHTANYMYDGDYTTFTCLKRNQQNGDTYTVELSETQTINRVRICMGTTNGDYMTQANVQISEDGTSWTSIPVLGTASTIYTLSLAQNKQVGDEVKACDFNGLGKKAKYVRLNVTRPNTSKWLRLYEIEVNGEDSYTRSAMEDPYGCAVCEAVDGDASTSSADAAFGSNTKQMIYYLQDYKLVNEVKFYCDPSTLNNTTFAISHDEKTWTDVTPNTSNGIATISLDENTRDITAIRIAWTGTTIPAIYEVVTNDYTDKKPDVTGIEPILANGSTNKALQISLENGNIIAQSAIGISTIEVYTIDGRKVMTQSMGGEKIVTLPKVQANGQTTLVRITLTDGTMQSYKVM